MSSESPNLKLHDISRLAGPKKKRRRVGRGHGSGRGKTSGRGQDGQLSRSGARKRYRFEGGQTPIMMRSPKLGGFSNFKFKKTYEPVNVGALNSFEDGATITAAELLGVGLIHGPRYKILGDGELTKSLIVHAPSFSRSAASKIAAAGGRAVKESDQAAVAPDSGSQS